ncbi:unnamed protein product [Effrenium voratum]|nr:unnamed protein product [Effrenium voratum]
MTSAALTSGTFEGFVKGSDKVLVDFVDRSMESWVEQKSELEQALRQVRDFGSRVAFATVDAKSEEDLAKKLVQRKYVSNGNFPQLLWFTHGEPTQYHRSLRTAKAMADFVLALDRDPMLQVKSQEEAASSFNRAIFATVKKGSEPYKSLEVVASRHMDTVAVTFLDSGEEKVMFLDETKGEPVAYSGQLDVKSLDAWVREMLTKSEPIPEGHPEYHDGSLVVVGKTFEEVVACAIGTFLTCSPFMSSCFPAKREVLQQQRQDTTNNRHPANKRSYCLSLQGPRQLFSQKQQQQQQQ